MNITRFLLLPAFFFLFSATFSQTYNFRNYSIEQGLPQSTVFCILQDSHGYLWTGTESGLARFDGTKFITYNKNSGLPDNTIRCIIEDRDGYLWAGTDNGIGIFNGLIWKTLTSKDGIKGTSILKIAEDRKGKIWVATNDSGINIITRNKHSYHIDNLNKDNDLSGNFVFDIHHDKHGRTWLAMIGGINVLTSKADSFQIEDIETKIILPSRHITCIEEDEKENFWFGTLDAGAFCLSPGKGKTPYSINILDQRKGLNDANIWDIFCQKNGDVWFTTNSSGVYRLSSNYLQNISTKNGLPYNQVLKVYQDRNRNLWFGTMGSGLVFFQGFHPCHYSVTDGLPGSKVLAVKCDKKGDLWIGGDEKGLVKASVIHDKLKITPFYNKQGFFSTAVNAIDFDDNNHPVIGTKNDGIARSNGRSFMYIDVSNGLAYNDVYCIYHVGHDSLFAGTNFGYSVITRNKIYSINKEEHGLINNEIQTIISDRQKNLWMGTMGGLVKIHGKGYRDFDESDGLPELRINALVTDIHDDIIIGTSDGIFKYSKENDTIKLILKSQLNSKIIKSLVFLNDTILIASTPLGFDKIHFDKNIEEPRRVYHYDKTNGFKSSETNLNAICKDKDGNIWFGTVYGLTCYRPSLEDTITETPVVHITDIRLDYKKVNWADLKHETGGWFGLPVNLVLPYNRNHITFDFTGIYLRNPEKVRFRSKLNTEKNWSPETNVTYYTNSNLPDGKYCFSVIASHDGIHWSEPVNFYFTITPPFWKTWWFYTLIIILTISSFILYVKWRERKLVKEKMHLEMVVKERTAEVVKQKEKIEEQHKIVSTQKQEITDSITYAQRIQQAVLPGIEMLEQQTDEHFILFKPRDIVSGDFYWISQINGNLVVVAADCTGHGVPGAFMSMLCVSLLNKIINEHHVSAPDKILNLLRTNIIEALKQKDDLESSKDGMDMSMCIVDFKTNTLSFGCANNSALVISNNDAVEIKADRMPVGLYALMDDFSVSTHQFSKGDCVYMHSDGFQDQVGGPNNKKFMRKNLRTLLLDIYKRPFSEQREILNSTIEEWRLCPDSPKGPVEQMDDILVIGFKL